MGNCRKNVRTFSPLINCSTEAARVIAFALITKEKAVVAEADPDLWSDPAFWTSETYGGDIVVYQETSGAYAGADVTAPGKATQGERLVGKNHTLTLRIESVKGNEDHWDDINLSNNYYVAWVTDFYNTLFVSTRPARVSANVILQDDLNSILEWEVVANWSDIRLPKTYDVPAGIFQ